MNLPTLKPNITLKAKNPVMAYWGHYISLVGGFFLLVSGFFNILGSFLAFTAILTGSFILLVEWGTISFASLKDSLTRGIVWMLLAAFSFKIEFLAILITFVGAGCYLVYHTR